MIIYVLKGGGAENGIVASVDMRLFSLASLWY